MHLFEYIHFSCTLTMSPPSLLKYYCDAAGELYDQFKKAGCNMFGFTSTEGYSYTASKAVRDGQFIGQMFDQRNQKDLTEGRAVRPNSSAQHRRQIIKACLTLCVDV